MPEESSETLVKLRSLTPVAVDRDAILFAAGRASARSPRAWKLATLVLLLLQLGTLSWFYLTRSAPVVEVPVVPPQVVTPPTTTTPVPNAEPAELDPNSYIHLAQLREYELMQPEPGLPMDQAPRDAQPIRSSAIWAH